MMYMSFQRIRQGVWLGERDNVVIGKVTFNNGIRVYSTNGHRLSKDERGMMRSWAGYVLGHHKTQRIAA